MKPLISVRLFVLALLVLPIYLKAQFYNRLTWSHDGNSIYILADSTIVSFNLAEKTQHDLLSPDKLIPTGSRRMLDVKNFFLSQDGKKLLIYTNSKKVWRYETRGDYWVYDFSNSTLTQLGRTLPSSSLMFAKFSPDGEKAAYVSGHNIYVEDLRTHVLLPLTKNGTRKLINGTFDWVYEEEFNCRDGFRWSPDSRSIAFWQINDSSTRDYYMLNTTDSVYSRVIPVEYPVVGQMPSPFKIGVMRIPESGSGNSRPNTAGARIKWMNIPTDMKNGTYLPRMEWAANSNELIVQRLNRSQNETGILLCNVHTGETKEIYQEKNSAWIDIISKDETDYDMGGWDWLNQGAEFLWLSEKDGWKHAYRISRDGKKQMLVTPGAYDIIQMVQINEADNLLYFLASPSNATQAYLYRCRLDGKGNAERITPFNEPGTHTYQVSPNGRFAEHGYSNYYTPEDIEWISLPDHGRIADLQSVNPANPLDSARSAISFFQITTLSGVTMDGWMQKPQPFDSTKKYPVLFYVYSEPGDATVKDRYGVTQCPVYPENLDKDGYIYISLDNRGTPIPKGASWRKSIYRQIGIINIQDQAEAAREIIRWPFVDSNRIAVWGWSAGGTATLNLMFRYPEIYKTGIAVSALTDMRTYDNIYMERYMGNPKENLEDYQKGSPLTYVAGLQGNLLYIHGSGDDNVHYNNAELLLNQLIRYNKVFQFMEYPNRSHSIDEGIGTTEHLNNTFKRYLNEHCPGGGK